MDALCRWNIFLNGVMKQVSQRIFRLKLICYGGNMINKNDIIDVIKIKNYMYGQCLSSNVPHNCNFNEFTIQLRYFFVRRYKDAISKTTYSVKSRRLYGEKMS